MEKINDRKSREESGKPKTGRALYIDITRGDGQRGLFSEYAERSVSGRFRYPKPNAMGGQLSILNYLVGEFSI